MGLVCDDRVASKQLSHLLQGYEVKALEVVASITRTDTAALLHDGWITYSDYDKRTFEKAIQAQLGLALTVEFKRIECKYSRASKLATDTTTSKVQKIEHNEACKLIDRDLSQHLCSCLYFSNISIPPCLINPETLIPGSRPFEKVEQLQLPLL